MSYYSKTDDISFVPLTIEEEINIFAVFYGGGELALQARDTLIARHLKLAAKLGLKFAKGCMPDEEAISAANFALVQALESKCFDPSRGVRFATYLRQYVRGQVFAAFRARATGASLNGTPGVYSGDAALTGRVGQINGAVTSAGDFIFEPVLEELVGTVDHEYENLQLKGVRREIILEALKSLPEMEAQAIAEFYLAGKNFAVIGREKGITREGVRKAHNRAIEKLRVILADLEPELS